jgi:diguanylate cyclase (GGDEF)-like protein
MKLWSLRRASTTEDRQLAQRPSLRRRDRTGIVVGALLLTALLAVFAASISHDASVGRSALTERFQSRANLSASFVSGYVEDLATRERAQAERLLSTTAVTEAAFEQVVLGFELDGAGLFDAQGRLIAIWPENPALLGEHFAERYAHVATALTGRTGVSGVGAFGGTSSPVIAVAVPFDTSSGRRVFSGALRPDTGSLRIYFDTVIPLSGRTYLVDGNGNVVVTGESGSVSDLPPMLTAGGLLRLDESVGTYESDGRSFVYVRESVAGAPWHVILTTPSETLYAPIAGASDVSWALLAAFAVTGLVGLVLLFRLARAHALAAATARYDALTHLPNRRAAEEHLERTASAASRHSQPYGLLTIDIDRFKAINDTYGHQVGDQVLCLVADILRDVARREDLVSRWGGEEFLVIMSATSGDAIGAAAERFRAAVDNASQHVGPALDLSVTISVGGTVSTDRAPLAALGAADAALYAAKHSGRNKVAIHRDGDIHTALRTATDAIDAVASRA